jgi:hypothetical protein
MEEIFNIQEVVSPEEAIIKEEVEEVLESKARIEEMAQETFDEEAIEEQEEVK